MKLPRFATRFLAFLLLSFTALAQQSKLAPDVVNLLSNPQGATQARVIVQFNNTLPQPLSSLTQILLGTVFNTLDSIPAVSTTLPLSSILQLTLNPLVSYVTLDRPVTGAVTTATDYSGLAIGANQAAAAGYTGKGIGVAILDSGIANHPDLQSKVVYRENFTAENTSADGYGHGTHVAGIVAGSGVSSKSVVRGVAPGVNLIDLRVLDSKGSSSDSIIIEAIDRAIALKDRYNIRVMNLSIGRPIFESYRLDPLTKAVDAAWKKGIVVVVAAGNYGREGYATILSPANAPAVITVGATKTLDTASDADDRITSYSSKGPTWGDQVVKPDLVAPGNMIVSLRTQGSTLDRQFAANAVDGSYIRFSGTSMASPMVAGAAALMLERNGTLTPDTVKARLMKSASKGFPPASTTIDQGKVYPAVYDIYTVGAGYLDIPAALYNTETPSGTAPSPWVLYNPNQRQGVLVNDPRSLWDNNAFGLSKVWGSRMLEPLDKPFGNLLAWSVLAPVYGSSSAWSSAAAWGSNSLLGQSAAWGSAAAWGSTAAWGSAAAWGSSAAWGSAAAWGSSAAWGSAAAWGSTAAWGSSAAWGSAAAWGSTVYGVDEK
jgi:serine protease AprX